jgi:glucosyl-3-phosphoglycerate synthase
MTAVRTFEVDGVTADHIVHAKAGRTVSLCIPCRNEATTIGSLVRVVRTELMTRTSVVDELIVLDDRSVDATAQVASQAGARVVSIEDVHRLHGTGHGKGNALWATLLVSDGDVVVWCDGDITSFHPDWILKLVSPLLKDDSVALIKALYHRPTHQGGGGRTTELVARPLLSRYYPSLTGLAQPLSGEFAARRSAVEQIRFVEGWGVEIAMLIDISARFGPESIGQVDLGSRLHRHRDLTSLSIQAAEVMATLLDRAGAGPGEGGAAAFLHRPDGSSEQLNLLERPSLVDLGLHSDLGR